MLLLNIILKLPSEGRLVRCNILSHGNVLIQFSTVNVF